MAERKFTKLGLLPILLFLLTTIGVITAYIIAVIREDVPAFIPFISEAGGNPPQSGIFGIFLCHGSLVALVIFLLRYHTVADLNAPPSKCVKILNILSLLCGLSCSLGMVIVACFPVGHVSKNNSWWNTVLVPHVIGAYMLFFVGVIYGFLQTWITFLMRREHATTFLVIIRLLFSVCSLVSLIVMVSAIDPDTAMSGGPVRRYDTTTMSPSSTDSMSTESTTESTAKQPSAVSVLGEWFLALFFMLFFLTFYYEFRKFRVHIGIYSSPTMDLTTSQGSTSVLVTKY